MMGTTALSLKKYSVYPEYKDSGIEWIGKIPNDWGETKLGRLVFMQEGPGLRTWQFQDSGIRVICVTNITENGIDFNRLQKYIAEEEYYSSYKRFTVNKGDILLSSSGNSWGKVAVYEGKDKVILNTSTIRLNEQKIVKIAKEFLYWLLQSEPVKEQLDLAMTGACQPNFGPSHLNEVIVPTIPLREQENISNFLIYETAKIDALITNQEKLIELLKEKRQAVISHAVTRGLNPDAPMKDSGVEWLGEVPANWVVKRLKHISPKIGVGLVINPSTYTREEGEYFIFGGDVKEFSFDLRKTRRISKEDSDNLLPSRLNHRDVVTVRVGYPGISAVVTEELEGSNCASVIIIRKGKYNSDWLCAAMNCWVGRQQVELVSYGAAQKQFNVADAIEFRFPYPSISEQNQIAEYILNSLNKFNELSEKVVRQITLLKERKTAVISAAVTGKIDVQNWQPSSEAIEGDVA
jgi:type I restriction enzyme, S subunit